MLRNAGPRALAMAVALAWGSSAVPAAEVGAACGCRGSVDTAVEAAVVAHPDGGPELADLVRGLVSEDKSRTQDVVCLSGQMSQPATEAAAAGLAAAGLSYSEVASWVCCGGQALLASFQAASSGSGGETPQCFGRVGSMSAIGLLTPSLSSTGYGEGFGTDGGSGGSGVTPSGP
jgi:hypothetical protein